MGLARLRSWCSRTMKGMRRARFSRAMAHHALNTAKNTRRGSGSGPGGRGTVGEAGRRERACCFDGVL